MKKILIVTYVFPPYVAVGGYRILKFCKYLPEFGFQPTILTPEKPSTKAYDKNMLKLVDDTIKIYRTGLYEPFGLKDTDRSKPVEKNQNEQPSGTTTVEAKPSFLKQLKRHIRLNLSVPDISLFWAYSGLRQGLKAIKNEKIDIVLSSSPPQSVHLLGSKLASVSSLPNILDFRDLWTQNTSYREKQLPGYLANRDRRFEESVLRDASGIIVNTDTFASQLREKNHFLHPENIKTVTNGVDPDDFRKYVHDAPPNEKFTMLYSGSLYGGHRNPAFFLEAVRQWVDARPEIQNDIDIQFIGNKSPEYESMVKQIGVTGIVGGEEWMPQVQLFSRMMTTDLLLLFQGFDPALNAAIPRKLFEYMITNKEILAFAPPGEIPKLIEKYKCGICLSNQNPTPIIAFLNQSYDRWKKNKAENDINHSRLRVMPDLETKGQVEKLAELCHSLTT